MVDPGMNAGAHRTEVVDGIEKVFSVLSSELTSLTEWRFLIRRLGLTNEDLAEIEFKYSSEGRREILYQCLLRWHSRVGEGATVVKLERALREEKLHRVAGLIKNYVVRTPCTRCPIGGHDASCSHVTSLGITRQKTKIKINKKQKFPSNIPKLPKIYSPNSSVNSQNSSRRSSTGSSSSRSSTTKKTSRRRPRTMSSDSTTSIASSANDEEGESAPENDEEVADLPGIVEPFTEIPEREEPASVENGVPPTPSPEPEVKEKPEPEPVKKVEPVKEQPTVAEKQNLQERHVTGHLRVEELIPDGGIPPNFTDLFKDMCAHLYKTIVKDAEDNIRALEEIVKLKNFFVRNMVVGSVIISMSCYGDPCYDELRERYKSGALLRACQKVFGRENFLRHLGLEYVRYSLYIDEFEEGVPPTEEMFIAPAQPEAEVKEKEEEEETKERKISKEETPEKIKREKTIMVTVEVCARLTASIETDIPTSSLLQTLSESGYRAANAKKYYKTITRDDVMGDAIRKMNEETSIPGLKFTRFDLKKGRVDVVMTCSSRKAINDAYSYFLKNQLLKICKDTLLTKDIKKKADNELIQLELEIQDEHITKCEKQFKEKLTQLRINRTNGSATAQGRGGSWDTLRKNMKDGTIVGTKNNSADSATAHGKTNRDSARAQGRGSEDSLRKNMKDGTFVNPSKREKSVISPTNSSTNLRRSSQESRRSSAGSAR